MNNASSRSESDLAAGKGRAQRPAQAPKNPQSGASSEGQNPQYLQPYLTALDPGVMKEAVTGNPLKRINFCEVEAATGHLKTRDYEEFQGDSEGESDIKTPLSQEINGNNIFDQISLKPMGDPAEVRSRFSLIPRRPAKSLR